MSFWTTGEVIGLRDLCRACSHKATDRRRNARSLSPAAPATQPQLKADNDVHDTTHSEQVPSAVRWQCALGSGKSGRWDRFAARLTVRWLRAYSTAGTGCRSRSFRRIVIGVRMRALSVGGWVLDGSYTCSDRILLRVLELSCMRHFLL